MSRKKPTHLVVIEGNPGKRPIRADLPAKGVPTPYEGLNDDHLALWHEIVDALPDGLLTAADNLTLERVTRTWALYRKVCDQLNDAGLLYKSRADAKLAKNPYLSIKAQFEDTLSKLTAELGLSPLARSRIDMPPEKQVDPMKQLLEMTARKYNTNKSSNK